MPRMRSQLSKIKDYPVYLEKCWQEHLKPKAYDAPTVISIFAGCGGSSLGYSMAGFRELLAVEWNDNAIATFKLNFPDVPVYRDDIANLTVNECLKLANIEPGQLDILDSSPPCQGFSTAGKRQMTDKRNQLYMQFVRLLRGLKPKVFVMENVSGLVKGKMKLIFAEIMRELKSSGYNVSCRLLNAKYFGVPQSRNRLIFIGIRNDLEIVPSHPIAESKQIAWKKMPNSQGANDWLSKQRCYSIKMHKVKQKEKGNSFHAQYLEDNKPFPTMSKTREGLGCIYVKQGYKLRYPTIDEMKYAASYPNQYQMTGSARKKHERIGDSVPPLMMRSIAKHIKMALLPQ